MNPVLFAVFLLALYGTSAVVFAHAHDVSDYPCSSKPPSDEKLTCVTTSWAEITGSTHSYRATGSGAALLEDLIFACCWSVTIIFVFILCRNIYMKDDK